MSTNELPIRFPLLPETKEMFFYFFSTLKNSMGEIVAKQLGMQLPESTISEICQIFFYVCIDNENVLDKRYKFGVDIVNSNLSKHVALVKKYLLSVASESIARGVPSVNILEYLRLYYEDVHKKLFPNQPIILI